MLKSEGKLAGKVALVTGAGSSGPGWGNGKATAALFAREGAIVIASDISLPAAEEAAAIIAGEGGSAIAVQCDVTSPESVEALVSLVVERHGRIDILHNNVGTLALGGPVEASLESWRRVLDVNLTSMFLTCKYVLPVMVAGGAGSIINVSSIIATTSVGPHYISYSSSKAAVNQFTRSVAIQYADRNIRCNAIMPGLMRTPMVEQTLGKGLSPEELEAMLRRRDATCPMGRMGDAWDVARAALFFASDDSSYVTGQALAVDGGVTLRSGTF
jgi:NAD(P)-dependent dehydrogenase (short-subunit alcohol dehydrogenase family)